MSTRPTFNYDALSKSAMESEKQARTRLATAGLDNDAINALLNQADWGNRPAAENFGVTNLKEGDVLFFPLPEDMTKAQVVSVFGGQNGTRPVATRQLVTQTENGEERRFSINSFYNSGISRATNAEVKSSIPDNLRTAISGKPSQAEQMQALCEFLKDKALKVTKIDNVETTTVMNGNYVKRNIYTFDVVS